MKLVTIPNAALKVVIPKAEPKPLEHDVFMEAARLLVKHNGAAIAANQLGITDKRFWVQWMDPSKPGGKIVAFIEPEFTHLIYKHDRQCRCPGPMPNSTEGCLSIPGQYAVIHRQKIVELRAWVQSGIEEIKSTLTPYQGNFEQFTFELEGFNAFVAQHEMDHLDGKLFTEYLSSAERSRIHGNAMKYKKSKGL